MSLIRRVCKTLTPSKVPWDDIVGIDYARPLHQDGRLVLEARTLTKRTFRSQAASCACSPRVH
eukprot:scaffold44516_cov20-Tisochrysis_lutea.AAC.1